MCYIYDLQIYLFLFKKMLLHVSIIKAQAHFYECLIIKMYLCLTF